MSYVAQSARGIYEPLVPQSVIDKCDTVTERFMTRWRGEPDPNHVKAVDAYFVSAAEHGMNASTFTGRVIASTGADVAAGPDTSLAPVPVTRAAFPVRGSGRMPLRIAFATVVACTISAMRSAANPCSAQ